MITLEFLFPFFSIDLYIPYRMPKLFNKHFRSSHFWLYVPQKLIYLCNFVYEIQPSPSKYPFQKYGFNFSGILFNILVGDSLDFMS